MQWITHKSQDHALIIIQLTGRKLCVVFIMPIWAIVKSSVPQWNVLVF